MEFGRRELKEGRVWEPHTPARRQELRRVSAGKLNVSCCELDVEDSGNGFRAGGDCGGAAGRGLGGSGKISANPENNTLLAASQRHQCCVLNEGIGKDDVPSAANEDGKFCNDEKSQASVAELPGCLMVCEDSSRGVRDSGSQFQDDCSISTPLIGNSRRTRSSLPDANPENYIGSPARQGHQDYGLNQDDHKDDFPSAVNEDGKFYNDEKLKPSVESAAAAISTPSRNAKRLKDGVNLNKQSQKKPRKKKYWPKVVVEGEPNKTPKPKTPKSPTPMKSSDEKRKCARKNSCKASTKSTKDVGFDGQTVDPSVECVSESLENHERKYVEENSLKASQRLYEVCTDEQAIDPSSENVPKTCRRALNFNLSYEKPGRDARIILHQYKRRKREIDRSALDIDSIGQSNEGRELMVTNTVECLQSPDLTVAERVATNDPRSTNPTGCQNKQPMTIYRRKLRKCQYLKNSWKLELPKKCKKMRIRRKKRKDFSFFTKEVNLGPLIAKEDDKRRLLKKERLITRKAIAAEDEQRKAKTRKCPLRTNNRRLSRQSNTKDQPLQFKRSGNANRNRLKPNNVRKKISPNKAQSSPRVGNYSLRNTGRRLVPQFSTQDLPMGLRSSRSGKHNSLIRNCWERIISTKEAQSSEGFNDPLSLVPLSVSTKITPTESIPRCLPALIPRSNVCLPALIPRSNPLLSVPLVQSLNGRDWNQGHTIESPRLNLGLPILIPKCNPLLSSSLIQDFNGENQQIEPIQNDRVPNQESQIACNQNMLTKRRFKMARHPKEALVTVESLQDEFSAFNELIWRLECLSISDEVGQLTVQGQNASGMNGEQRPLVPYYSEKQKALPKVDIDQETMRVWKLLMESKGGEQESGEQEMDEGKEKWWKEQRDIFRSRVDSFIARMHLIQGDRRFSPWKGSVVDSIVGAFLTQNVSDHLSSSAFMSLAAKFPLQSKTDCKGCDEVGDIRCNQGSIGNNTGEVKQTLNANGNMSPVSQIELPNMAHKLVENDITDIKTPLKTKKDKVKEKQENPIDWEDLRRKTCASGRARERTSDNMDSLDWEGVRQATVDQVADAIKERGQHRVLASRIKEFLDRVIKDHGSINLEWLRDVPPDEAKEYLLSFKGLGLKSVECIRLLSLHHHAFPVDTNVGRAAVRLGWVPLQTLPESLQIHLLEQYPVLDSIQKYLWPRLCTLDQRTLYELHYQMITFGKVFCGKRKPNCNACPMRGECRHFASEFASSRLALPGPQGESMVRSVVPAAADQYPAMVITPAMPLPEATSSESRCQSKNCEPIIDMPASPEPEYTDNLEKDIEDLGNDLLVRDIEDLGNESYDDIPTIRLDTEEFEERIREFIHKSNIPLAEDDMSKAIVAITSEANSIPVPKLKNVSRLKTVHHVYELPDSHPILVGLDRREPDDPSPYLLAIWTSGEKASSEPLRKQCNSKGSELCNEEACFSCNNIQDQTIQTVSGTILIPCRTATRGSFPLNGTYFQVNEVFADDESSQHPLNVPRALIWNLRRRSLYCGANASAIFRGLSTEEIQHCFWKGFVCVRAFNRKTRTPTNLSESFHVSTNPKGKRKFTKEE